MRQLILERREHSDGTRMDVGRCRGDGGDGFGQGDGDRLTPETFQKLEFRSIGPSLTTGRISDIAVDPKNANVWYVAASAGNLWKTENRGNTWTPIFESYGSYSLGAVVVDPKNSNVVWLGTGENNNQRSVGFGDGIYKSMDAGATWTRMGLESSEHIQNILIDPRDSNVVYVSAIGPLWNAGGDRGLYKTIDGGKTWKAVLTISPDTGVTDVAMDPKNPNVLYAAAYQRRRAVGQLVGGGPESGLYKTTDGGGKWTKLTKGLPTVEIGRIGVADQLEESQDGLRARHRAARAGRLLQIRRCRRELDTHRAQCSRRRTRRRTRRRRARRRGTARASRSVWPHRRQADAPAPAQAGGRDTTGWWAWWRTRRRLLSWR